LTGTVNGVALLEDYGYGGLTRVQKLFGDWTFVFPELDRFESKADRKTAMRRAGQTVHATAWFLAIAAVGTVVGVIVKELIWKWLSALGPVSNPLFAWVMFIGVGTCYLLVIRKGACRSLREQLNAAGRPTCMQCGYDLRGQIDPRCPECGREFTFQEFGKTEVS